MDEEKFSIDERKHHIWMTRTYNDIVIYYIDVCAMTESIINWCIAYHFNKNEKIAKQFVETMLVDLHFKKKMEAFIKIIKSDYIELYDTYCKEIDEFLNIYSKKRNLLAHSFLSATEHEIKKKEKHRLPFRNMASSLKQTLYLNLPECYGELKRLKMINELMQLKFLPKFQAPIPPHILPAS